MSAYLRAVVREEEPIVDDALKALGVIAEGSAPLSEARMRVAELHTRFGLTDREIAKATDADPRTVARWRLHSGPQRASRYDEPLERLLEIVDALEPVLGDPQAVRTFLCSRNRHLDGARPLNLLGAGRYREVREAITRRRAGEPARRIKRARVPASLDPQGEGRDDDAARRDRVVV